MYMIHIDEAITHPALINKDYIRADEYDPTKNTPIVIALRLDGKKTNRHNRRTNKLTHKRIYKRKRTNKKKRTNKRKNNSTKRILK